MAYVIRNPDYTQIKLLSTKSLPDDSIVKHWAVEQVDACFRGVSRNILCVPGSKALWSKSQQEHQTLHNGVLGTGTESLIGDHIDNAIGEHKRPYPECKFVRGTDQRNVPYRGLVDESQKGFDEKLRPKSGAPSSSRNETSGSGKDIARVLKPLSLQESKPAKTVDGLLLTSWPITSPVDHYDLPAAGIYCVNDTTVQCFACCGRISEWRLGDRPRDEHRRLFPALSFIYSHWTENVPLLAAEKEQSLKHFAQATARESQPHQISPNLYYFQKINGGSSGHTTYCLQLVISSEPTDLTVRYPGYPHKSYEQVRLETFSQWLQSHKQIPANLSKAGFFATGSDEVKRFFFGGGLKKWEELGDDPWEEHARRFTCCEWLLPQIDPGSVDNVRRKHNLSYFKPTVRIHANQNTCSTQQPAPPLEDVPYSEDGAHNWSSSATLEPVTKPVGLRKLQPKRLEEKQTNKRKPSEERKPVRQPSYSWSRDCRPRALLLLLLPLLLLQPLSVFSTEVCPENQTTELGRQGSIICHFPDEYTEVHWFDNISETSSPVITYKPKEGNKPNKRNKYGQGLDSGTYDVLGDGSLIITHVSAWHERSYKAIVYLEESLTPVTYVISLRVIASPVDDLPMIPCHNCHQEYYHSAEQGDILSCSFHSTRPPVQLEWFKKLGDGYEHLEMQQFDTTENNNGTFNSLATVHLLQGSSNLTQLLVCRATWPLSDGRREREILVDFSRNISFSDVTPKIQHMEINRYAKIQCGQSTSDYVVWKRILPNRGPEIIGYHLHGLTETISDISDVEVSVEGSLIFASPQVHHEGMYVLISGDGQTEEIQMTSVEILILPSPPYIQITGCDDVSRQCVIRENSTKKLTCAVYGARPNVTLEWIAEDGEDISFFNHKLVFKQRGETADTILSVEYEVSQNVLCDEEILIKCRLNGSLSNIMKAESTALVHPASCRENEVKEEHGLGNAVIALIVLYGLVLMVIAICLIIYCICGNRTRSTTVECSGGPTRDSQEAFLGSETREAGRQIPNGIPPCIVEGTDEDEV